MLVFLKRPLPACNACGPGCGPKDRGKRVTVAVQKFRNAEYTDEAL
jgi:hypothetical protein